MSYSFDGYLEAIDTNWYDDDPQLQALLKRHAPNTPETSDDELHEWGALSAGRLRRLAEESARPENAPFLRHYDQFNRRVDEVVLPASTRRALREVEGRHRLGSAAGDPFIHSAKGYIYAQNGEAGVGCSLACTYGMMRLLEREGDTPFHAEVLRRVRESTFESYTHGAQFITEIQGGSDVPANTMRAEKTSDGWRLTGPKWFCSNINADYFVMSARPAGASAGGRGIALFIVPAYLEEGDWKRNGYRIERLKDKLGTRELATAECEFDGAIGYPIGPLDQGLANLVSEVLVTSRFACVSSAAAALRRAERTVDAYTEFRTAFGSRLVDFPLVREQLAGIRGARRRTLASLFELQVMRMRSDGSGSDESEEALDYRVMASLTKPVLTREATEALHDSMMLLGANGIEERFCALPRLYRDAVIMETWEGPHNVLFSQAIRDMTRFEIPPRAFVERMAGEARTDLADELESILANAQGLEVTVPFAAWARKLVRAFGERAAEEAT
jgi:alkylation response protein AidB-like acyl-CoA dehydrogenase